MSSVNGFTIALHEPVDDEHAEKMAEAIALLVGGQVVPHETSVDTLVAETKAKSDTLNAVMGALFPKRDPA